MHSLVSRFASWLFLAAASVCSAESQSVCKTSDLRITFSDGTRACASDFSFFSRAGVIDRVVEFSAVGVTATLADAPRLKDINSFFSSGRYWQRIREFHVLAMPRPAESCPLAVGLGFNSNIYNPVPGRALVSEATRDCVTQMNQMPRRSTDSPSCTCEALIVDGKTTYSRQDFAMLLKKYEQRFASDTQRPLVAEDPREVGQRPLQPNAAGSEVASESHRISAPGAEQIKIERSEKVSDTQLTQQGVQHRLTAEAAVRQIEHTVREQSEQNARREVARLEASQADLQRRLAREEDTRREEQLARQRSEQKAKQELLERERLAAEVERLRGELAKANRMVNTVSLAYRKAFVVGIDSYEQIPRLTTARADAQAIANILNEAGFTVALHLDSGEKELRASWRRFVDQVEGGSEVIFFFAGHGVQIGGLNYLIPADVGGESERQLQDDAIPLQRVLDDMTDRKAKLTLAVIDACRDNPFRVAGRNIGRGGRGLAPTTPATGQMVIFSAGAGQRALDSLGPGDTGRNGVFTRVFIEEIKKRGVSIDRIVRSTRSEVVRLAKSVGHDQIPAVYDQTIGEFFLLK